MSAMILVIEDEPAIQELISAALQHAGHRTTCALSAEEANVLINGPLPDVVLIDWMLPGMSGIQYARKLRGDERTRDLPIILLTARSEEQDKVAGLEAGADDYLTKPFSMTELLARIRAVLRRIRPALAEDIVSHGNISIDRSSHRVKRGTREIHLGPTEYKLLDHFLSYPGRVFSREQLLDAVWGSGVYVDARTVDVHIGRLRKALTELGEADPIRTVRSAGYALDTSNAS